MKLWLFLKNSFKNITNNFFLSFFYCLVIGAISTVFLVVLSIKSLTYQSFVFNEQEIYQDIDIIINLDNIYSKRFFSTSPLNNYEEPFEYIIGSFMFPVQSTNKETYLIYFVDYEKFSPLINGPDEEISYYEILVSNNSKELLSSHIQINFNNNFYDLEIKNTFEKKGIFKEVSTPIIIIDRKVITNFLPFIQNNIYNSVYLKVKDEYNKKEVINEIKNKFYSENIVITNDVDLIKTKANNYSVNMSIISLFTLVPLSISLFLLIEISLKNNFQNQKILSLLGSSRTLNIMFFLGEFLIYLIVGFLISIYFTTLINTKIIYLLTNTNSPGLAKPNYLGFGILMVFCLFLYFLNYLRINKLLTFKLDKKTLKIVLSSVLIILFGYLLFRSLKEVNNFLRGLWLFIFSIVFLTVLLKYLIKLLSLIFKNNYYFLKINLHQLMVNKLTFMIILITSFAAITIILSKHALDNYDYSFEKINDNLDFDFAVLGIMKNHDRYLEELSKTSHNYSSGYFYTNVEVIDQKINLPIVLVSQDKSIIKEVNDNNQEGIYLPKYYQKVYNIGIGTPIRLRIDYVNIYETKVIGFLDDTTGLFSYIALNSNNFLDSKYNALYISSDSKDFALKEVENLVLKDLAVITEKSSLLNPIVVELAKQKKLFYLFIFTIFSSFLVCVVFLYRLLLQNVSNDFKILGILGYHINYKGLLFKFLVWFGLLAIISSLGTFLMGRALYYFILKGHGYFDLTNLRKVILKSSLWIGGVGIAFICIEEIVILSKK